MHQTGVNQTELRSSNTTRATSLYVEGKEKDKPKEEVLETTHDKATSIIQGGGENNSGFKEEPKNNTTKKQGSHQDQKVPPKKPRDNPKHQGMETITSRDIMSMVKKGEITYRQAETKFEELGRKFSRKMTMKNIMDMMNNGELTMEEGEIELRNLESRENKDNNTMNDKHDNNRNKPVRPDPVKPMEGYAKTSEQQLPRKTHATIVPPYIKERYKSQSNQYMEERNR